MERLKSDEASRLIEKFRDFARNIAVKLSPELPIEMDDAIQVAYVGLVEAANRFDVSQHDPSIADLDTNFKSFAYLRIRGSIYDQARRNTFVKRRGLEKGMRVYMQSIDEFRESEDGSETPVIQLEALSGDPDLVLDFEEAMTHLTDRERHVVLGLAVGAKGDELARELGITPSRISQIASGAREKLERELQ